jgi:tetratricopeptide (TPR) repeat protein/outer membrane protein assembly factor BamB
MDIKRSKMHKQNRIINLNRILSLIFAITLFFSIFSLTSASQNRAFDTRWKTTLKDYMSSSPVLGDVSGDGVYDIVLGDQKGELIVLDGQSGDVFRTRKFDSAIDASPILIDVDNKNVLDVLLITRNGIVSLYNPRIDKVYWNIQLKSHVIQSPSFYIDKQSNARIYISDENTNIYCLKPGADKPEWIFELGIPILTGGALYDFNKDGLPEIVVGCSNGNIYVIDGKGKNVLYKFTASGRMTAKPAIGHLQGSMNPIIFTGGEDQKIYLFKPDSSEPVVIPYKTNGAIKLSPSMPGNINNYAEKVAFPSTDKNIYIVKADTGKVLTVITLDSAPSSVPVWLDMNNDRVDDLLIGTELGSVYLFDGKTFASTRVIQLKDSILSILSGDLLNNSKLGLLISTPNTVCYVQTDNPVTQSSLLIGIESGGPGKTGLIDSVYFNHLKQKMKLHLNDTEALFDKAKVSLKQRKFKEAELFLQEVLAQNPQNEEAQTALRNMSFSKNKPLIFKITLFFMVILIAGTATLLKKKKNKNKIEDIIILLNTLPLEKVMEEHGPFIKKNREKLLLPLAQAYARSGVLSTDAKDLYETVIKQNLISEKTSLIHYQLARCYIQEGSFTADNFLIYEAAYKFNKNDSQVCKGYVKVLQKKGEYQSSIPVLESLLKNDPSDKELLFLLANGYMDSKCKDPGAIEACLKAFEENKTDDKFVLNLARYFREIDYFGQPAGAVFIKANEVHPEDKSLMKAAAKYLLDNGHYSEACAILTRIEWNNSADAEGLFLAGWSMWGSNQWDKAVDYLSQAHRISPDDPLINKYLGLAKVSAGDSSDETYALINQALQYELQSPELYEALVKIFLKRADIENALTALSNLEALPSEGTSETILSYYQQMAEVEPDNPKILQGLFKQLLLSGAYTEAFNVLQCLESYYAADPGKLLPFYTDYLKVDRNSIPVLLKRGKLYSLLEMFEEAMCDLEKVMSMNPDIQEVLVHLEKIYIARLKTDPYNLSTMFKLGNILFKLGDYERSIEYFQKTFREKYREIESSKFLGKSFMEKGMLDLSYRHLSTLEMDDENKEMLYELAQRYIDINQNAKALVILEHIYAVDINFREIKSLIARLREQTLAAGMDATSAKSFDSFNSDTLISREAAETAHGKIRYELLQEIGRGNMGIVCLAKDTDLDEMVALKFLPQELRYDTMILERFKQEVRSTRKLTHPNIVRIYDMGEEAGRRFISMEYINGRNLKDILFEKTKLLPLEAIDIGIQVSSALSYAHKMKVVHRDIKPANIMVTDEGHVKVMDFGIASMMERAGLTQTGAMIGTPLYMSPEQAEGKPVDGRSDIYSLGIMMYEFVEGHPPFFSGNISYQHLNVAPPPITAEGVPICLINVIMKCLEKNKEDRYQNAEQCIKDLEICREKIISS